MKYSLHMFKINNLYLPHRKLYIRNFQPIYNTVQHIFRDTSYILVFNTFATLGVPYTVKGHKFRRWKTNAGNTPGKTKRFFVFKSLLCLPLINGCLITSRMARNITLLHSQREFGPPVVSLMYPARRFLITLIWLTG